MTKLRIHEPAEELKEMHGHKADCRHCDGVVKMLRSNETFELMPDKCHCFGCGQRYYMYIKDIRQWEASQWEQKSQTI